MVKVSFSLHRVSFDFETGDRCISAVFVTMTHHGTGKKDNLQGPEKSDRTITPQIFGM